MFLPQKSKRKFSDGSARFEFEWALQLNIITKANLIFGMSARESDYFYPKG